MDALIFKNKSSKDTLQNKEITFLSYICGIRLVKSRTLHGDGKYRKRKECV